MKKIGIVTFHNTRNYGASLQMFALSKYLQQQGHEVEIIDYISNISKHYSILFPKLRKNVIQYVKQLISNIVHHKELVQEKQLFEEFNKKYVILTTKRYRNINALKSNPPKKDIYIAGSDQIWNATLIGKVDEGYLLDFGTEETRRVSYAASIGAEKMNDKYRNKMISLIRKLDMVSVREESAKVELEKYMDKPVSVVTDPVFLLTPKQWEDEFQLTDKRDEKYIFVYLVVSSQNVVDLVNEISMQTGYPIYCIKQDSRYKNVGKVIGDCDPRMFVECIKNAEYVISNSFHATAFSIMFCKKFFVIPHSTLNARIDDLLKLVDLQNRQIMKKEDLGKIDWKQEIDCQSINMKIDKNIQKSKEYLRDALK